MTRKTRVIVLLICVACFLVGALIIVPYSMGYRFDFQKMKITATGGIYVRSYPVAEQIIIDSKLVKKPAMFSNDVFVQSLLPNNHSILVEKPGYYSYSKTLPVLEKQVTKLEDILLIKKNLKFEPAGAETPSPFETKDKFVLKNGNLYTSGVKATLVLKKVSAFALQGNSIIWLGTDGFVYKSDPSGTAVAPVAITKTATKITKAGSYNIIPADKSIFLNANGNLLMLNEKTGLLENFLTNVEDAIFSSDGKEVVYWDSNNIYLTLLADPLLEKHLLYKSNAKISDCLWVNTSHIVVSAGDKIVISETDFRGQVNTVTLPETISPTSRIFFSQQSGKLYILNGSELLISEKII